MKTVALFVGSSAFVLLVACTDSNSVTSEPLAATSAEDRVSVALYRSDSCGGDLVAVVSPTTDCAALGPGAVWGVKVGTQCFDISDTTASSACDHYRAASNSDAIGIYHSDSCAAGDLVGYVDEHSDCAALGASAAAAWGVRINGTCQDISDTSFAAACASFHSQVSGGVQLFRSDSCGGDLVASVGPTTDCDALAATATSAVWGVKFGNACHDVADTNVKAACEAYKAAASPAAVPLFRSDSCASGELVGVVDGSTNCTTFASVVTSAVWGVAIDGACNDISDTNALSACTRFSGGSTPPSAGVAVFDNDSCTGTPATLLQPTTNCATLGGSARAVRVAGVCANIRDTTLVDACNRYRDVDP